MLVNITDGLPAHPAETSAPRVPSDAGEAARNGSVAAAVGVELALPDLLGIGMREAARWSAHIDALLDLDNEASPAHNLRLAGAPSQSKPGTRSPRESSRPSPLSALLRGTALTGCRPGHPG